MKSFPIFILLLLCFYESHAQTNDVWQITYLRKNNGKVPPNQDPIIVLASASGTSVSSEKTIKGETKPPFEISFVDRTDNSLYQIAFFANGKTLMTQDSKALAEQKIELLPETQLILGYTCKKATTVVNSNRIDLWYTEELKIKGAPSALGQNLGLVLKMVRNGNSETEAVKIEKNTPWATKNQFFGFGSCRKRSGSVCPRYCDCPKSKIPLGWGRLKCLSGTFAVLQRRRLRPHRLGVYDSNPT